MKILEYPDPFLRRKAAPVENFQGVSFAVIRMFGILRRANGVGLAATQVGLDMRLFVIHLPGLFLKCVNPVIVSQEGEEEAEEFCLSLPSVRCMVKRATEIQVEYQTPLKAPVAQRFSGQLARIFQHELDHLDGVLIIDHAEQ